MLVIFPWALAIEGRIRDALREGLLENLRERPSQPIGTRQPEFGRFNAQLIMEPLFPPRDLADQGFPAEDATGGINPHRTDRLPLPFPDRPARPR